MDVGFATLASLIAVSVCPLVGDVLPVVRLGLGARVTVEVAGRSVMAPVLPGI